MNVVPIGRPIDRTVSVPGSKSATNRALVLAALSRGVTTVRGAARCDDSARTIESLVRLGFDLDTRAPADDPDNQDVIVHGGAGRVPSAGTRLEVGNAGTAARFLTALVSVGRGRFEVDGDPRMRERPIGDLVNALVDLGADARCAGGCPPVAVVADGLKGGRTAVSAAASSQFLSALLMVAPTARAPVILDVPDRLTSRPYVDLTLQMMSDFGVSVSRVHDRSFSVAPAVYRSPGNYAIEPDASAASYAYAAAALLGGRVRVRGLTAQCRQGDAAFVGLLESMGCAVGNTADGLELHGGGTLAGVDADLTDMPDVAPTLAAIAPFAASPTIIRGIASARRKECDRVSALCAELGRLGVAVEERADGLVIQPCGRFRSATIRTYNDHRIAMAFAVVGLREPGISIENPDCVSKTFPRYFHMLEELRQR